MEINDEVVYRLKEHAREQALRMFDEPRLGEAAFRLAECTEQLSREERAIVLLFTLLPTVAKVDEELQRDVLATVIATMRSGEELGATLWLAIAKKHGVGVTPRPRTV